jgi:hypothetical protein
MTPSYDDQLVVINLSLVFFFYHYHVHHHIYLFACMHLVINVMFLCIYMFCT